MLKSSKKQIRKVMPKTSIEKDPDVGKKPQIDKDHSYHQTDITEHFKSSKINLELENSNLNVDEAHVPGPDDAALPCSTSSQRSSEIKVTPVIEKDTDNKPASEIKVGNAKRKNLRKKGSHDQVRNTLVTDFFPVRRSSRTKTLSLLKEKEKNIEEAILSGNEEGFEVKEFPDKGRGVITTKALKQGEFVLEYAGELIDRVEANNRESLYASKENVGCYMYYFKLLNKQYCIDATKESGRLGRLINHSKKGNLKTKPIFVDGCPHLVLCASRDINPGEELLYDYGDRSKSSLISHPWLAL